MHVSNPVTSIDRMDWTACVHGGCVYALGIQNERSTFNEQAWQQWKVSHNIPHFVDVTAEFLGQFD
ncbi:MAG: hypothetical protein EAZ11_11595 [Curvibacter sp.]|nr:MAG: hypothetical protein EAZ11_11595 [Curvibacter sp.]